MHYYHRYILAAGEIFRCRIGASQTSVVTIPNTIRSILFFLLLAVASGQTAKKKIVVVGLDDATVAELRKSAPPNVRLVTPMPGQLADEVGNADALISPLFTRDLLRSGKQLRWEIGRASCRERV